MWVRISSIEFGQNPESEPTSFVQTAWRAGDNGHQGFFETVPKKGQN
jgi:hypothetical protein